MPEEPSNSDQFQLSLQVSEGFRKLHDHENELLNHRFQWFGLMTGLLAATYGLLWEFKSSAEVPMLLLCIFGGIVSFSASLSSLFTRRAHQQIDDTFDQVVADHRLPTSIPIRGCNYKPTWRFLLPWNLIYPMFCAFWIGMAVCVVKCACPVVP